MTDSAEAVVNRYAYDSFGALKSSETIRNAYAYTGREYDSETGLYYYRARYYDPEAGRFVSKDPIGFAGGDVNLFNHVAGNPLKWIDPWGLWTLQIGLGGSAGAGKGVTAISGFAVSYSKEHGLEFGSFQTQGAGGYGGVSASFSLFDIAWSKNKSICELRGSAGTIQTSVGHPLSPFSFTGEMNLMSDVKASYGFSVNFGKGKTWLEEHGFYTHTWVQKWGAIQ